MGMQPLCEPVELPLGTTALVSRVRHGRSVPPVARMLHFHDVAEIVLFGAARGRYLTADATFPITPGCAVYAPTMQYHDFQFEAGEKGWTLIQFDPYLIERLGSAGDLAHLSRPFCATPDAVSAQRLAVLADWLVDAARDDAGDPLIEQLVGLVLAILCRLPSAAGVASLPGSTQLARFQPVIERLRANPGAPFPLARAARLCHVSRPYFSRRFAAVFGCGFADYVTSYRLHVASRRIATSAAPLAQIAYSLGFSSPSHFTARFRERFGVTPSDFRGRHRLPLPDHERTPRTRTTRRR